jgi:hypothetical protein
MDQDPQGRFPIQHRWAAIWRFAAQDINGLFRNLDRIVIRVPAVPSLYGGCWIGTSV